MKVKIEVASKQEGEALEKALSDPAVRAFNVVIATLMSLESDRARRMTRDEYEALDIIGRLRFRAALPDDTEQWPEWLFGGMPTARMFNMVQGDLRVAITEIEFLRKRAGVVSGGEDLASIKDRVHPGRRRE